jgi:DNA mismatch endonuclease (patch repair protein)
VKSKLSGDVFSKEKRSVVMARIRSSKNKSTELAFMRMLRAHGFCGWRRGSKLPGKPDFVFVSARTAVFVDGCFWHGCPTHATQPKNNAEFWRRKIAANITRDRRVNRELRSRGWHVLRIWEHELARKNEHRLLARLRRAIPCCDVKRRSAGPQDSTRSTSNRAPSNSPTSA